MDGSHWGLRRGNGFDFAVQGLSQTTQTQNRLDGEHGNQQHDDQDHKKNPHRYENTIAKPWVVGNRSRCIAVRAGFQLSLIFFIALCAPKHFHIKRVTRFIIDGQRLSNQDLLSK